MGVTFILLVSQLDLGDQTAFSESLFVFDEGDLRSRFCWRHECFLVRTARVSHSSPIRIRPKTAVQINSLQNQTSKIVLYFSINTVKSESYTSIESKGIYLNKFNCFKQVLIS